MTYDTIEIEDMDWSEELQAFTYQCPCGDLFQITMVRFAGSCAPARCVCRAAELIGAGMWCQSPGTGGGQDMH